MVYLSRYKLNFRLQLGRDIALFQKCLYVCFGILFLCHMTRPVVLVIKPVIKIYDSALTPNQHFRAFLRKFLYHV